MNKSRGRWEQHQFYYGGNYYEEIVSIVINDYCMLHVMGMWQNSKAGIGDYVVITQDKNSNVKEIIEKSEDIESYRSEECIWTARRIYYR
ncbi:hypothetical protein [Eshraghiella crossota]|uniref:hypothetical protein n=1 Tax=Eshraghiella crossota TaxID=45851 RepID=UPI003AB1F3B4